MPARVGELGRAIAAKVDSAETFEESGVTTSHSSTIRNNGALQLGGPVVVDDYEDGDVDATATPFVWTGWRNGTPANATIESSNPIEGDHSLAITTASESVEYYLDSAYGEQGERQYALELKFRIGSLTGNGFDDLLQWEIRNEIEANAIASVAVKGDGAVDTTRTTDAASISGNTTHTLRFDWDFTNDNHTVSLDGNAIVSGENLENSSSGVTSMRFIQSTFNSGATRTTYIDSIREYDPNGLAPTSGEVTVEWPYPPDVYGWDTVLFKRDLANEAVDVYVQEAQGSPGWTDVTGAASRGDAIPADPANNVRYRVVFSRADRANNPTLDAIYRRRKL